MQLKHSRTTTEEASGALISAESKTYSQGASRPARRVGVDSDATIVEDRTKLLPMLRQIVTAANEHFRLRNGRVRVRLDAEAITVATVDSTAIVMFAYEAVSNACGHAFPHGRTGVIRVALKTEPGPSHVLRVADDGIGIRNSSIDGAGRPMMRAIADHLRAGLTVEAPALGSGTSVILKMKPSDPGRG